MEATYTAAVQKFIKHVDWLTEEHEPAVTALVKLAKELDDNFSAATMAQYGLTYRYLMKQRPQGEEKEEEDDLLKDFE